MSDGPKGGYYRDEDGKGFHDAWGNKIGSEEHKTAVSVAAPAPKAPKKAKRAKKAKAPKAPKAPKASTGLK